jgi:SAM-dependent methyltransferase
MTSPTTRVSTERWLEAQEYELDVWKRQNVWPRRWTAALLNALGIRKVKSGDDWNEWWFERFDAYRAIPDKLENAIELGCGPYTNMRLIRQNRDIDHVVCSDPLARHYIHFRRRWLAAEYRKGTILVDDHPIEECPFADGYFDLVVLINVLDHVKDGLAGLNTAVRITKPAGYLVIGQDLTSEEDAANNREDIGHPIRLHQEDIDQRIRRGFESVLYQVLPREKGRNPQFHYGTYLFIGRKKP